MIHPQKILEQERKDQKAEIARLRAERDLWQSRVNEAAEIIEWNVQEITRLRAEKEALLAALKNVVGYYAGGAVRLRADVEVPKIARAAVKAAEQNPQE